MFKISNSKRIGEDNISYDFIEKYTQTKMLRDIYSEKISEEEKPNEVATDNLGTEETFFVNCTRGYEGIDLEDTNWFLKIKQNFYTGVSHSFILHGNIFDYAIPGFNLEEYLGNKIVNDMNIKEICTLDYIFVNKYHGVHGKNSLNIFGNRLNSVVHIMRQNYGSEHRKAVIIKYPEILTPNCAESAMSDEQKRNLINIHTLMMDEGVRRSGNLLILIAESKRKLHQSFFSSSARAVSLEIKYPNEIEREKMVDFLNQQSFYGNLNLEGFESYKEIVNITSGMTRMQIEDVWKFSCLENKIVRDGIKELKKELIKKEFDNYLEIYDVDENYNLDCFGGMNHIKEYLKEGIIKPIQNGDTSIVPKGLLFMGPPGTGKTFLAKCIASESGLSFAEIKMSKFLSKWVGETENNLEKVLNCISSLSPVFVFLDEIDQILRRGDEDSNGVRGNIFQMILNFMSSNENRGKVIWIAATNYPNRIDEAIKRAGRFDLKLVFSPPTNNNERKEVFKCQFNKINYHHSINFDSIQFEKILDMTYGYTQAEIESIVVKTLNLCKRRKIDIINYGTLIEAITYLKRNDNKKTTEMIKIAIDECNDLEFINQELYNKYCKNEYNTANHSNTNYNNVNHNDAINNYNSLKETMIQNYSNLKLTDEEIEFILLNRDNINHRFI